MAITGMPASTAAFRDFLSAAASGIETTSPCTFCVTAASINRDIATMSVVCGASYDTFTRINFAASSTPFFTTPQ
jgi:hypothetical protein